MKGTSDHSGTPLAIFLTPIVFGVATWLLIYVSESQNIAQDYFPIIAVVFPFVTILGMLLFVLKSRYVLLRLPLYRLTALSCLLTSSIWIVFWFGGDWLWMGPGLMWFVIAGVVLITGPTVFIIGLVRLRGRGGWTVPANECIHCSYDLAGLDKDAVCPECGNASGD